MKRIGLLIDTLIGGGAEKVTLNLARMFSDHGHEVHIFIIQNIIEHEIDIPSVTIHALSNKEPLFNSKPLNKLALSFRLRNLIKTIQYDGTDFAFFISSGEDFDRLTRIARIPNVYIRYRNSMWHYLNVKIGSSTGFKRLERKLKFTHKFRSIYGNRNIITVSKALISDICEKVKVKPKSIINIYNPFPVEEIRALGSEQDDFPDEDYAIYVARFENRKRHDLLIEALSRAKTDIKLVLLGNAYTDSDFHTLDNLHKQIDELGLTDRVIFPGFKKNPFPWVRNARLFIMSSDSEGLPTVLIESLILGTPVISTDCPTGPSEILTGDLEDYLSPVNDPDALAKNIDKALESYPAIESKHIDRFDSNTVVQQYLNHCSDNAR